MYGPQGISRVADVNPAPDVRSRSSRWGGRYRGRGLHRRRFGGATKPATRGFPRLQRRSYG